VGNHKSKPLQLRAPPAIGHLVTGFGKVLGFVICFLLFLGALQVAYDAVAGWYDAVVNRGSETAAYVASFWPF
jgi:hypothetical protein